MSEDGVEHLKVKRKEWLECLSCDDRNGILPQIYTMVWQAASFRVIAEARSLAPHLPRGGVALPGLLHHLLDVCFFQAQLLAIRRQTDKAGLSGKRGVYSLMSLLQDIQDHRNLLTRENMLGAEGLLYVCDYDTLHEMDTRDFQRYTPDTAEWFSLDAYSVAEPSQQRHRELDDLCGVHADSRSPEDTVQDTVLEGLQDALVTPTRKLAVYVDKFLAHAATPESRADNSEEDLTILVAELWAAHAAICRVTQTVSTLLLNDAGLGFLAIERGDEFMHFDQPLAQSDDIPRLRAAWSAYETETQNWSAYSVEELGALRPGPTVAELLQEV